MILATVSGTRRKLNLLDHETMLRDYSTNTKVAKVDSSGVVQAVGKGTCTAYAMAVNGLTAKITVRLDTRRIMGYNMPIGHRFPPAENRITKGCFQ